MKLNGSKFIHWWMGSDALKLNHNPPNTLWKRIRVYPERWITRFLELFTTEHWVVHERLIPELKQFGITKPIKVVVDPPIDVKGIKRKKHPGFNILYYYPKSRNDKYIHWCYGIDIIQEVKRYFPLFNFIEVDGSQDMKEIYPIVDCYIRPNRWDGMPRMVLECEKLGIPYYWELNGKAKDCVEFIKTVWFDSTVEERRDSFAFPDYVL